MDGGAVLLVGGDDQGQDTAVNDELHGDFLIRRKKVGLYDLLYNRFISYIFSCKVGKSSSRFIQATASYDDMINILEKTLSFAGVQEAETLLIVSPKPT